MYYFDNASTSFPKPDGVAKAVYAAINMVGSSGRGATPLSLSASRLVYETRMEIAKLFHIKNPLNVAFTQNATESLNAIIKTMFTNKDHVIITEYEHNAMLRPLYEIGCEISIIPFSRDKVLEYEKLNTILKPNTKAIFSTHASNVTGDIIDISTLGKFAKDNNLLFILDVAQTAGYLDVDMEKENIDFICFTGHKSLLGPQGTGGICVNESKNLVLKPFKTGGSGTDSLNKKHPSTMPDCFEAGTQNAHSLAGLLEGIQFINKVGRQTIYAKEYSITHLFYEGIKDLPHIKTYGKFDVPRCPIVSFNFGKYGSQQISDILLDKYNISTRAGVQCAPLIHYGLKTENQGVVRFSFSYFNTEEEVMYAIESVSSISRMLSHRPLLI